jgi:hypothetical protein
MRWLPLLSLLTACGQAQVGGDAGVPPADLGFYEAVTWPPDSGQTDAVPGCPAPPAGKTALGFDGVDDHVTMGVAPQLGLAQFTVEAWVRRDGVGKPANTGVGGLDLVPVAGKGRGESDGSTVDCNYLLGFWGDVLGADFEDMATGANHPVMGRTGVPRGEWHHVAVTFDGSALRLYLDGKLDGETATTAVPRHDSIQHFGIGAAFDSKGNAAGRLQGAVDELRVWSQARTQQQLADSMFRTLGATAGLVGRWALDEGAGVGDSAGSNPGTIAGGAAFCAGAALDRGAPPTVTLSAPAAAATVSGASVELLATVGDEDQRPLKVGFYVRELSAADNFSVAVLPDTQHYSADSTLSHFFYEQTQWIRANRAARKIVAVLHNGDVTNNATIASQWTAPEKAFATLEQPDTGLPDGIPYGVSMGNHDADDAPDGGASTIFNKHFGLARFDGRSYYGGHHGSANDASWIHASVNGVEVVALSIRVFLGTPDAAMVSWMRSVFRSRPSVLGLVNSHFILHGDGTFGTAGQDFYDALKDLESVQVMTCGHVSGENRRSDTDKPASHTIHSLLADFQSRANGGGGWMRLLEFSPLQKTVNVKTYTPSANKWETDADSQFSLPLERLAGIGRPLKLLTTLDAAAGPVSATYPGLVAGRTYEWQVTVSDCAHTSKSPISRFTTAP